MSTHSSSPRSIEKITLKPVFKELLYKSDEKNISFDVLACSLSSYEERSLGHLFVLGNVSFEEQEDMSYIVNLILSLAKREYYSKQSQIEQEPRMAFERTLKKLNEVLENFFSNKDLKLDIGLAAISHDNLYVSRIGKLKVALARDNEYIDVINNIQLFSKDINDNLQFSNVISGKIKPSDKIFAYIPFKAMTLREKMLKTALLNQDQEQFTEKIAQLATSANNFSCCGLHISIEEVNEIPLRYSPASVISSYEPLVSKSESLTPDIKIANYTDHLNDDKADSAIVENVSAPIQHTPTISSSHLSSVIPTALSVGKRYNLKDSAIGQLRRLGGLKRLTGSAKLKAFSSISALIIVPLIGLAIFMSFKGSGASSGAYKSAHENVVQAEAKLDQDQKEARRLLYSALGSIASFDTSNIKTLRTKINADLNTINKTSDKKPGLYTDLASQHSGSTFIKLGISNNAPVAIDSKGSIITATQDGSTELGKSKVNPSFFYTSDSNITVFNGNASFENHIIKTKKIELYTLKNPSDNELALVYKDNLYTVSGNTIFKYSDIVNGGNKKTTWGTFNDGKAVAMTIDGTIYILTGDGKLVLLFKGQKSKEFDLGVQPSTNSTLLTSDDGTLIFLADKDAHTIYAFSKSDGSLQSSYRIDQVGTAQDVAIAKDGSSLWILSSDGKIWKL